MAALAIYTPPQHGPAKEGANLVKQRRRLWTLPSDRYFKITYTTAADYLTYNYDEDEHVTGVNVYDMKLKCWKLFTEYLGRIWLLLESIREGHRGIDFNLHLGEDVYVRVSSPFIRINIQTYLRTHDGWLYPSNDGTILREPELRALRFIDVLMLNHPIYLQ